MKNLSMIAIDKLSALLQLTSPALPIGGFSYSQGLEAAVDAGYVSDESSACAWIAQMLNQSFARCEAVYWCLLYQAWTEGGHVQALNAEFLASRDSSELVLETTQMGSSLYQLALQLGWTTLAAPPHAEGALALPTVHSHLCVQQGISLELGLAAYTFVLGENLAMAALKTVPLGQVATQRIIHALRPLIGDVVKTAQERAASSPARIHSAAPLLSILSARHEQQYSRLFRS
jgi:urease accessory protein